MVGIELISHCVAVERSMREKSVLTSMLLMSDCGDLSGYCREYCSRNVDALRERLISATSWYSVLLSTGLTSCSVAGSKRTRTMQVERRGHLSKVRWRVRIAGRVVLAKNVHGGLASDLCDRS